MLYYVYVRSAEEMKSSISVLVLYAAACNATELTALNVSPHAFHLYRQLRNKDGPHDADLSQWNALLRRQLCEDIIRSGFFEWHYIQGDIMDVDNAAYSKIFHALYSPVGEYVNPYTLREINYKDSYRFEEHVFVCPLKNSFNNQIYPFLVSKEYDVGPFGLAGPYMPGRFIFGTSIHGALYYHDYTILAEKAATAYTEPGFDVELHYLRIRKNARLQPAAGNDIDPLCKHTLGGNDNPRNQHSRLCVAVHRSSVFKDTVRYPQPRANAYPCREEEVSFKSAEAVEMAAGEIFHERMTLCYSSMAGRRGAQSFLYLSRAYKSNAVFVFRRDTSTNKIYLENLSLDIGVLDDFDAFVLSEISAFEFVEF